MDESDTRSCHLSDLPGLIHSRMLASRKYKVEQVCFSTEGCQHPVFTGGGGGGGGNQIYWCTHEWTKKHVKSGLFCSGPLNVCFTFRGLKTNLVSRKSCVFKYLTNLGGQIWCETMWNPCSWDFLGESVNLFRGYFCNVSSYVCTRIYLRAHQRSQSNGLSYSSANPKWCNLYVKILSRRTINKHV